MQPSNPEQASGGLEVEGECPECAPVARQVHFLSLAVTATVLTLGRLFRLNLASQGQRWGEDT